MIVDYQVTEKVTKNGKEYKLYKGEDAHPFDTAKMLIVADGLGGRGGWPHTKIVREITDKSKFYSMVFAPVFEKDPPDEIKRYIMGCFSEIFDTRDYYFKIPEAVRSSGYFASRLVSSICAYEFTCDIENFDRKKIFEAANDKDPEKLQSYGDKLAAIIDKKLRKIAKNLNLVQETEICGDGGTYLLPTTLQVALIEDRGDKVEVVYFWAGDSRAYAWTERDGMMLLNEDHEDEEVMTNLISLTLPFVIETRRFELKKPCVLFNASDGCYKGHTPPEMEYMILNAINGNEDFKGAAKAMEDYFDRRAKHDDSNTMAFRPYGYDFASLKAAMRERSKYYDGIKKKLPDLFEKEYALIDQEYNAEKQAVIQSNGFGWIKNDRVKDLIAEMLVREEYQPFMEKVTEELSKLPVTEDKGAGEDRRTLKITIDADAIQKEVSAHVEGLRRVMKRINLLKDQTLSFIGVNDVVYGNAPVSDEEEKLKSDIERGVRWLKSWYNKTAPAKRTSEGMLKFRTELVRCEREYKRLLDENENENAAPAIKPGPAPALQQSATESAAEKAKKEVIAKFEKTLAPTLVMRFWRSRRRDVINAVWEKREAVLSREEIACVLQGLKEVDEKFKNDIGALKIRKEIYDDYDKTYFKNFFPSRLGDKIAKMTNRNIGG